MNNATELQQYLQTKPEIRPLKHTLMDSAVIYGGIAVTQTSLMLLSGLHDQLLNGDVNCLRSTQGAAALVNVSLTTLFSLAGRYQTYSDLHDFQQGTPVQDIIARADKNNKGAFEKAKDWTLANTFNINAWVSFPLCGLMIASGVASGRPGEAISGALLVWAYIEQLRSEKYGNEKAAAPDMADKKKGWLRQSYEAGKRVAADHLPDVVSRVSTRLKETYKSSPLIVSSVIASWRLIPLAVNAAIKGDWYQLGQFGTGLIMYVFKANTTKDCIGRYHGSIADPDNQKGIPVSKALLEGRLMPAFKNMFTPKPV